MAATRSNRIKKLDHYSRAVLATLPIALVILLFGVIKEDSDIVLSDWFLDLVTIPAFASNSVSGATYLARLIKSKSAGPTETNFTRVGVLLGTAVSILLPTICHVGVPFSGALSVLANAFFAIGTISSFGGIFNRIGSCFDEGHRPACEKKTIGITAILAFAASITLVALSKAALISVVGVTTFATGGAALPLWLTGGLFIVGFTSTFASSADYFSKMVRFIRSLSNPEKLHEYRGSAVGSGLGLVVAAIVITALALQPHILVGAIGVITAFAITATCVSVLGGLASRTGRLIDNLFAQSQKSEEKVEQEQQEKKSLLASEAQQVMVSEDHSARLAKLRPRAHSVPNVLTYLNERSVARNETYSPSRSSARPIPKANKERDAHSVEALSAIRVRKDSANRINKQQRHCESSAFCWTRQSRAAS